MHREIALTEHPINLRRPLPPGLAGPTGAVAEFQGLVRAEEAGRTISALEYEAYSPMAERTMQRLCDEIPAAAECGFIRITHRVGLVPVGEAAIQVVVASRHRAADPPRRRHSLAARLAAQCKRSVLHRCGDLP